MPPIAVPTSAKLDDYLVADDVVDHRHPLVRARVGTFGGDAVARAEAAFLFVRDEIGHAVDAQDCRVTWRASDVLREGVGLCYAKAHLLAALLRAQGIPAGFCYQRFHILHGLNAVHLNGKWSRLDARGNRTGATGEFSLDVEKLAWPVPPEDDLPEIHPAPARSVIDFLMTRRPGPGWYENGGPTAVRGGFSVVFRKLREPVNYCPA